MGIRGFTISGFMANNATLPVNPGMVVVHIGNNQWLPWAQAQSYTGGSIGAVISQATLPGQEVTVQTDGPIPFDLYNLGAGTATYVVASGTVARGSATSANIIGTCDNAGVIIIEPSYLGTSIGIDTTLSGDVTGPASNNTVVALTGSGNLVKPATDNTLNLGNASNRMLAVAALAFNVYATAGAANATSALTSAQLALGGGGSALDVRLARTAARTLTIDDNNGGALATALVPVADTQLQIGTAALRVPLLTNVVEVFLAAGNSADALRMTTVATGGAIYFGAGGAAGKDARIYRSAANTLTADDSTGLGVNFNPAGFNLANFGSNTAQWNRVTTVNVFGYITSGDANAAANLAAAAAGGAVILGAGGVTAPDVRLQRTALTTLTLDNNAGAGAALNPPAFNTGNLGSVTAAQWNSIVSNQFQGFVATGDPNASIALGSNGPSGGQLTIGPGGATPADVRLRRTAISTLTLDNNGVAGITLSFLAASTISTAAGALSITSAAAATWQTTAGSLTINGGGLNNGINLQANGATLVDIGVSSSSVVTLSGGTTIQGQAGTGGLSFGVMTGNTTLPTGSLSWAGASTKSASLVTTGAGSTFTITAGAASTWSTSSGALTITGNGGLALSTTLAAAFVILSPASQGNVQFNYALTALGASAGATLGATGGSGPGTPGQNSWLKVLDNGGAAMFIPVWK